MGGGGGTGFENSGSVNTASLTLIAESFKANCP